MRGDTVLVRAFEGDPLRRVVWECRENKIMVLHPESYERALGGEDVRSIGFPVEDVFEFDLSLYESLRRAQTDRKSRQALDMLWAKAMRYGERPRRHENAARINKPVRRDA